MEINYVKDGYFWDLFEANAVLKEDTNIRIFQYRRYDIYVHILRNIPFREYFNNETINQLIKNGFRLSETEIEVF